ncbi:MAG: hypothetical protein ACFFDS_09515 [Candidatus Thorarchaeota archaeon]
MSLKKNKKAQIRGVDFALALLIFVIAFSQVIIVLSNLLIPSMVQLETYSQEQELNKLYTNIFLSTGNPSNWGYIGTSSLTDFRLGLLDNKETLDYTKINRLSNGISDYWYINYISVKASYGLTRDFAIGVYSPISIDIDYSVAFDDITITGQVTEHQTPIENADVWVFVINGNNEVYTNYTTTKVISDTISFKSTFVVNVTNFYSVVAFAQVGEIYQDYTTLNLESSDGINYGEANFDLNPFVRENTVSLYSSIDVSLPRSTLSDEAAVFALFPFKNIDVSYYKYDMLKTGNDEGNVYLREAIPIPSKGLALILLHEREDTTYRRGFMGVPMFLSSKNGGIYGTSADLSTQGYISETRVLFVRSVLIKCQIWYW